MKQKMGVTTYKFIDSKTTEFLHFRKFKHVKKKVTFEIDVENKYGNVLGEIKWYGPWRRYVFHPCEQTLFDASCLKEITKYINKLMEDRKKNG